MIYIYPNTISTFQGDKEIAIESGYLEIDDQTYTDLVETKKKWQDGNIVDDSTYEERKRAKEAEEEQRNRINSLKHWFDVNYRKYNEKLTRLASLGIEEVVSDPIRLKEYATLHDLYLEAEVVRSEINELEQKDVINDAYS